MHTGMTIGGRYAIGRPIGRGGFGEVWEGSDSNLHRDVAIKFVTAADGPKSASRYTREAKTLATLKHRAVVAVHDAGTILHEGRSLPFLVMERLQGATWETAPAADVPGTGAEIADALAYIHAAGVVHRDVKPPNIMICDDGRAVLMDFGIARDGSATRTATATGLVVGTPGYMAPEQLTGKPATSKSDVYALGLVLVEKLVDTPAPARQLASATRDRIPRRLRRLLDAMTDHDPDSRPTAAECAQRLRDISSSAATPAAGSGSGSSTVFQLNLLAALRARMRAGSTALGAPGSTGTRVLPTPTPAGGTPASSAGGTPRPPGRAAGRLRAATGNRTGLEMFAGAVILLVRLIRDALILTAAVLSTLAVSRAFVTLAHYCLAHPAHDHDGNDMLWAQLLGTAAGNLAAFGALWAIWWAVTSRKKLGRSIFAKFAVRALITGIAPILWLQAFAPAWTATAVPAAIWGGWLLYVALRKLQQIDEKARRRTP